MLVVSGLVKPVLELVVICKLVVLSGFVVNNVELLLLVEGILDVALLLFECVLVVIEVD